MYIMNVPSIIDISVLYLEYAIPIILALYDRVQPSDRIKLSVSKVTIDQYDRLHSDLYEIRRAGMIMYINHIHYYYYYYYSLLSLPSLSLSQSAGCGGGHSSGYTPDHKEADKPICQRFG